MGWSVSFYHFNYLPVQWTNNLILILGWKLLLSLWSCSPAANREWRQTWRWCNKLCLFNPKSCEITQESPGGTSCYWFGRFTFPRLYVRTGHDLHAAYLSVCLTRLSIIPSLQVTQRSQRVEEGRQDASLPEFQNPHRPFIASRLVWHVAKIFFERSCFVVLHVSWYLLRWSREAVLGFRGIIDV